MKTKDELPDCPVATTVQLIGNKWKLLILRYLLARPWQFNELRRGSGRHQPEGADGKPALPRGGRDCQPHGLRRSPARVEYALTELGESMRPILDTMQARGDAYKAGKNG